jgi:hypothetical protein
MAIQYVNTGTSPNSGNGDSIRTAFTKVNNNFDIIQNEIYNTILPNQALQGGKFLTTDGTTASWALVYPDITGNTGKFLVVGTSATEWSEVFPDQALNTGKFLGTDGTNPVWEDVFPVQTGNTGKFLSTDGTGTIWDDVLPALPGTAGQFLYSDGVNISWASVFTGTGRISWFSIDDINGATGPTKIAIGRNAGATNQGEYSIALGYNAGVVDQASSSIVINATTETSINGDNSGLYVNPVRSDLSNVGYTVYYNTETKELTWSDTVKPGINSTASLVLDSSTTTIYIEDHRAFVFLEGTQTNQEWVFSDDGTLRLPDGGDILDYSGLSIIARNPFDQDLNTISTATFVSITLENNETPEFLRLISSRHTSTENTSLLSVVYSNFNDFVSIGSINSATSVKITNDNSSAFLVISPSKHESMENALVNHDAFSQLIGTSHRPAIGANTATSRLFLGLLTTSTTALGDFESTIRFEGSTIFDGDLILAATTVSNYGIVFQDGTKQTSAFNIEVSSITGSTLTNTVTSVTAFRFDTESGFDVSELSPGTVKIGMNSTFKTWKVDGQADLVATGLDTIEFVEVAGISIFTNPSALPYKQIGFSATVASIVPGNGISTTEDNGAVTINLNTSSFLANFAANLAGGSTGQLVYQLAPNSTSFINTSSVVVGSSLRSGRLETTTGVSRSIFQDNNGNLIPERPNIMGLGNSTLRWTNLYLTTSTGVVYFGNNTLQVNTGGNLVIDGNPVVLSSYLQMVDEVPVSSASTGTKGQIALTTASAYICVATDYWLRFDGVVF